MLCRDPHIRVKVIGGYPDQYDPINYKIDADRIFGSIVDVERQSCEPQREHTVRCRPFDVVLFWHGEIVPDNQVTLQVSK